MMINQIKILGERNTGTNYITKLLSQNMDVRILGGGPSYSWEKWFGLGNISMNSFFFISGWRNLGWKHAAPNLTTNKIDKCNFIVVVKNPYSWLLSLHKRPYHNWDAAQLPFSEFIEAPWPLMHCDNIKSRSVTPVELWNIKNKAYYDLTQKTKSAMLIKYEDILDSPENFVRRVSATLNLRLRGDFVLQSQGAKSADKNKSFDFYRDYYLNESWQERLAQSDISIINECLDTKLMDKLGYSMI